MKHTLTALLCLGCLPLIAQVSRPRIVGVAHVALRVHDLEASRHFYRNWLGFSDPISLKPSDGKPALVGLKVNDRQYIELTPESNSEEPRLWHVAFETDNTEGMRQYLKSQGLRVPEAPVAKGRTGDTSITVEDPEGNQIEFVQHHLDSLSIQNLGKDITGTRISGRLLHAGVYVSNPRTARFYIDVLGFREFWRGSVDGKVASYSNLKVPEGDDYIEFMLSPVPSSAEQRGVGYHLALEVDDMAAAISKLNASSARGDYKRQIEQRTGINRKRQANLFDPDGTRVELMESYAVDGLPSPLSTAPMFKQ